MVAQTSALIRWLVASGGMVSDSIELKRSVACGGGIGVFARQPLEPFAPIAAIPLDSCITAADACADVDVGPNILRYLARSKGQLGADAVAVASLLAHARFNAPSSSASARWGPYLDLLPWETRPPSNLATTSDDPLGLLLTECYASELCELDLLADAVHSVLGGSVSKSACLQALRVTASRCFSLARYAGPKRRLAMPPGATADGVLVPLLDGFNHFSRSALAQVPSGGALARAPIRSSVIRWEFDETAAAVRIFAPERPTPAGSELFNFYDFAGADSEFAPNSGFLDLQTSRLLTSLWPGGKQREWAEGEAFFVARYAFSPWE